MRTVTLAITGMHCASCGLLIDDVLLDVPGVSDAETDRKTERCTVTAGPGVTDQALLDAVVEAGYTATVFG